MCRGLWPWEAPSIVFYDVWRLQEVHILTAWWYRFGPLNETNTLGAEDPGWELGEAGSDECLEDPGLRELHLSYSTRSGGSWQPQIPPTDSARVGALKQTHRGRERGGSEARSLDVDVSSSEEFESWKFGCLEKFGCLAGSFSTLNQR